MVPVGSRLSRTVKDCQRLLKAYEGTKEREKSNPKSAGAETRIPDALDALIELYTAAKKPEEVKGGGRTG